MKILARVMASIGFCALLVGGGTMDNPNVASIVMILGGIALMWNGLALEEQVTEGSVI